MYGEWLIVPSDLAQSAYCRIAWFTVHNLCVWFNSKQKKQATHAKQNSLAGLATKYSVVQWLLRIWRQDVCPQYIPCVNFLDIHPCLFFCFIAVDEGVRCCKRRQRNYRQDNQRWQEGGRRKQSMYSYVKTIYCCGSMDGLLVIVSFASWAALWCLCILLEHGHMFNSFSSSSPKAAIQNQILFWILDLGI